MTNAWRNQCRTANPERLKAVLKEQRKRYWAKHGRAKNWARKLGITINEARADLKRRTKHED